MSAAFIVPTLTSAGLRDPHFLLNAVGRHLRSAGDEGVEPLVKSRQKGEVTIGKANFTNVDEYISAQPETAQAVLQLVRSTLRKALEGAEEVISYKIPANREHGGIVLYFAGWKERYSLYPAGERRARAFKDQLASYKVSQGTIRFPLLEPVPVKLIERIAKFRAKEAVEQKKSKPTAFRKR